MTKPEWYIKIKGKQVNGDRPLPLEAPLEDSECYTGSIYLIKVDGSLWTLNAEHGAYMKVREGKKAISQSVYYCVRCKAQANEFINLNHTGA